ncbi:bifunctional UDP-N-acetylmuramoyl-tripeptide:D-alanyl-D-alanine ligase/alanine racemase [Parapedobacter tibetensis]|uniref:bifunctional UDP-N-acetylmuramoyl-tripeptide:D-alanyl-D-alanine ligase/alanine racemase n=1 Tax=Parapedobacter tibetensis TaxID=2972951 RepID=UPI00214D4013|nr:bifunctional UDP-N-acetylmuramoyl-tripeptide:D-alanyl-D-alanine ligase/alanine racemase [Parapedobacter tibetensis]
MHKHLYTILEVAGVMPALRVSMADETALIGTLLYDSRKLADNANGLFFALEGRRDGHRYISDVYANGVRNFVVTEGKIDIAQFTGANFIVVENTLDAMQELAAYHRSRFTYPIIGITGSNGKTIVKEWLWQLLSPEYRVMRSPKSYNSQIGVALSLWQLDNMHDLAIIEAGISQSGEMEALHRMIRPDIAVLTTIGPAHDEGFASREEKIQEKLKLFDGAEQAVYSPDHTQGADVSATGEHVTWGKEGATLQVMHHELLDDGRCSVYVRYKGEEVYITIPFTDGAAMENATCCWAVLLAMGYDQAVIAERMTQLQAVEMRLEMKKGINNCTIIDDSYSNDLSSLAIALDFLKQQHQHPTHTLVLSDMPGGASHEEQVYNDVSKLLNNKGIYKLISIGPDFIKHRAKFDFLEHRVFPDMASFLTALPTLDFHDELILLKGARKYAFEHISRLLTAKSHDTVLQINLNALEHNLNQYKSLVMPQVKLMAMVKAFSYGSGSFEVANLLQFNKVDYLAVAYVDEGVELRKAGIRLPIMVMSPNPTSLEALLAHELEPEIYSFSVLDNFVRLLTEKGIEDYPIHIKVDTGMHRLGFSVDDIGLLINYLRQIYAVKVRSVFSHLAAAGDAKHDKFTEEQLARFNRFTDELGEALGYPFVRHIANTAGIQRWPQAHWDMVRLGIGLYGIGNGKNSKLQLQQVSTLKTTVTQIRQVPAGETVGYGRKGVLAKDSTIATVNIGYADGYDRRFGNGVGFMAVNGRAIPTVGDICMDMTMLDASGVDVHEGDEVVVFGDIELLAQAIGTIPYELLAGISQRVKRVYYYG